MASEFIMVVTNEASDESKYSQRSDILFVCSSIFSDLKGVGES